MLIIIVAIRSFPADPAIIATPLTATKKRIGHLYAATQGFARPCCRFS